MIRVFTFSYKRLNYVCATINALKAQTHAGFVHHLHLLGYTKEQGEFVRQVANGDERFVISELENLSQRENLMRILAEMPLDAEYYIRMDDDDVYLPTYLHEMHKASVETGSDLTAFTTLLRHNQRTGCSQLLRECGIYGMTMCLSRKAVEHLLSRPNWEHPGYEDSWMDRSLELAGYKRHITQTERPLVLYVQHATNISCADSVAASAAGMAQVPPQILPSRPPDCILPIRDSESEGEIGLYESGEFILAATGDAGNWEVAADGCVILEFWGSGRKGSFSLDEGGTDVIDLSGDENGVETDLIRHGPDDDGDSLLPPGVGYEKTTIGGGNESGFAAEYPHLRTINFAMPRETRHGNSLRWGIQTTYQPRENLPFLEEWLQWHLGLGAEFFNIYDNTGSTTDRLGNSLAVNGLTRYGHKVDISLSDKEILEIEHEILCKYPVQKVIWQPRENGRIVMNQVAACDHFSGVVKEGWCAFIDMDEFLLPFAPMEEILRGGAVRIRQKKFADRVDYARVLDCERAFTIDTSGWATKLIMDMAHYVPGQAPHIHGLCSARPVIDLPLERMRFNHYNHGRLGHEWLLASWRHIDPEWRPVPYEKTFDERCKYAKDRARDLVRYKDFVPVPMRRPGDHFS